MRTDEEIIARIEALKPKDLLGFDTQNLILSLPFEAAKPYLREDAKAEDWKPEPRDYESLTARMLDYMPFAWEKANNFRGISAWRSLSHFSSWIWLAGDDLGSFEDYEFYGKDILVKICNHYGWDSSQWDDGVRKNSEGD